MRITQEQAGMIRDEVRRNLGRQARVWLFGSRADDNRRGGDIDIYVETEVRGTLMQALRCKYRLEEQLDLHVDLVVKEPGQDKPIFRIARAGGTPL
jgi:predicted nucleotidyltransferase